MSTIHFFCSNPSSGLFFSSWFSYPEFCSFCFFGLFFTSNPQVGGKLIPSPAPWFHLFSDPPGLSVIITNAYLPETPESSDASIGSSCPSVPTGLKTLNAYRSPKSSWCSLISKLRNRMFGASQQVLIPPLSIKLYVYILPVNLSYLLETYGYIDFTNILNMSSPKLSEYLEGVCKVSERY